VKKEEENTMRKFLSVLLAMAMVLSLTVTGFAIEDTAAATDAETKTEATMAGKTVILHTNDVHGAVDGYAYIAQLKADYEAKGAEVILVDAGDYSQGKTYVSVTKGADAVTMMNAAGYDVVTLGNHEFDYGYAQLKENMSKAKFKVVCADVFNEDGTRIFDANYTYTTKSGVKVGFFGMETPETQTKANPALIKGLTFATGDAFTKAAADQVAALKDADVVICLAHLGIDAESAPYRSTDLYAAVKGIDFIIDGHSHTVMTKGEKGEPIQSTGTAFANIGVIVIDNATKKIESNSLFEIKEDTAKDATVAAAAKTIVDRVDAEYGVVFAKSEVTLNGAKAPNGNRDSETNNGDLITDAMLWKVMQNKEGLTVDADHVVAITNGGGIRAAIKPGDVTKKDINTVLPFGNTVAVIYVTGAELLEALEASTYSLPVGGFPQVAGINFTLSTAVAYDANAETYPASTYYGPKSINRVVINSINGKEFKADDTYAVVTNNFVAGGGDTYYAFAAATAQFDTGIPLDEAVMEYVTTELKGVIGTQYAAPQGRILLNPFKDVKVSSWFGKYVIDLYNDGVINGTSATTYAPNDTLTWAAALKLLLVSHGDLKAADATGADWSKNAIAKAAELGLVAADLDGAKAISRLEFCQVAAKLNKLAESKTESKFTDCTDGYVMALVDAKVISGMTETTFEPAASLTRAQIAKILYQLTLIEK
jgi:5'-nucleotidase/UDP-sugar diphosphatase